MDFEKLASIRSANESRASGGQTGSSAESVLIRDIRGKKESIAPDGAGLREGEFYAVKNVSFELRRGELRTLGRSEKEISEKCLGATKVPDSGRRRHQCLGLIGHNGAGTQVAWQPLGRLPQVAHRVNRDLGKVKKDCRQAAPKEKQIRQSANQTPWEGANQHDAAEDAEWVDQAGCGVDHDAGAGGGAHCARGWVQSHFNRMLSTLDSGPSTPPLHQWLGAGVYKKALNFSSSNINLKL